MCFIALLESEGSEESSHDHMFVADLYQSDSVSIHSYDVFDFDFDLDFSRVEGTCRVSKPTESKEEKFFIFLRMLYRFFSAAIKSCTL